MDEGGVILIVVLPIDIQNFKEVLGRADASKFEALLNDDEKSSRHADQRDEVKQQIFKQGHVVNS